MPTPSQAKNIISRCLKDLLYKPLSEKEKEIIRGEFPCCAYCGNEIGSRMGHFDHIDPISKDGESNIGNFVLACNICNGDRKREKQWEEFMDELIPEHGLEVIEARKAKIRAWIDKNKHNSVPIDKSLEEFIDKEKEQVLKAFEDAVARIRAKIEAA